ncbi:MAG TPA: TonB-dependent receptor, partial [Cyclobacteriaceae bacterium]|nr:TonB-dependent receptor [Cyclobacteriaceae bacterium]
MLKRRNGFFLCYPLLIVLTTLSFPAFNQNLKVITIGDSTQLRDKASIDAEVRRLTEVRSKTHNTDSLRVIDNSLKKLKQSDKVTLTGTITLSADQKPLSGAAIFVDGLKYGNNSDLNGRYFIQLPPGTYRLTVRYLGMVPIVNKLSIYSNGVIDFEMTEKPETLEEVVVSSYKQEDHVLQPLAGVTKLNVTEIRRIPALMGEVDVIKSIQLMPGVNSVGEGSAGFNVRGGRIDQNLILMDGGQIFNSSHALGLLSNFNPDVVEDFTLYKGNVPAHFGGRASSVLDVRTRSGTFDKYKVKGGIGILSSRLAVEGPIIKDKTSFLVGTRFSYSDWLLKLVGNTQVSQSAASFYDVNGNITHRLNSNNTINLSYYLGNDYFRYSQEFGYDYTTQLLNLKWKSILGKNWSSAFSVVSGTYESKLYDYNTTSARSLTNGIGYYQVKENLLYTVEEKHALNFGAEMNIYNGSPEIANPYGTASTTVSQRVEKDRGREFAFYFNEEYTVSPAISFSAGLRYSLFQNLGPDTVYTYKSGSIRDVTTITDTTYYKDGEVIKTYAGFEPRLSARFSVSKNSSIKISYNRMRQYIHLISNSTASTPVDIWQVSNPHISPQIADNYSIGYFNNTKDNAFELSAEAFYKTTQNLVEYKDFAHLLLNSHLETELLQGQGKAYGIELFAKKNSGPWTGWISYTFMRSFIQVAGAHPEETINQGKWYPTNYDKPHTFNLTANRKAGRNARFAFNFTYSTGRPVTALST